jgi:hypothetical protein
VRDDLFAVAELRIKLQTFNLALELPDILRYTFLFKFRGLVLHVKFTFELTTSRLRDLTGAVATLGVLALCLKLALKFLIAPLHKADALLKIGSDHRVLALRICCSVLEHVERRLVRDKLFAVAELRIKCLALKLLLQLREALRHTLNIKCRDLVLHFQLSFEFATPLLRKIADSTPSPLFLALPLQFVF